MSTRHELEIEIAADGTVKVHVKGAKGQQCLQYVQIFAELGRVSSKDLTSEYYEKPPDVQITEDARTSISRPEE